MTVDDKVKTMFLRTVNGNLQYRSGTFILSLIGWYTIDPNNYGTVAGIYADIHQLLLIRAVQVSLLIQGRADLFPVSAVTVPSSDVGSGRYWTLYRYRSPFLYFCGLVPFPGTFFVWRSTSFLAESPFWV